jgi:hypothetical protein
MNVRICRLEGWAARKVLCANKRRLLRVPRVSSAAALRAHQSCFFDQQGPRSYRLLYMKPFQTLFNQGCLRGVFVDMRTSKPFCTIVQNLSRKQKDLLRLMSKSTS